jgi:hypothetical protein
MAVALRLGAVKLALAVLAPAKVTAGPEVCVQANRAMEPSVSVPEPESVTCARSTTVCAAPASAVGAVFPSPPFPPSPPPPPQPATNALQAARQQTLEGLTVEPCWSSP